MHWTHRIGECLGLCHYVWVTWWRCQGLENTPRNKVFSNMWEGGSRSPHSSVLRDMVRTFYKLWKLYLPQFLGGTSGWSCVTITKFSTIKSSLSRWLFWVWDSLGSELESSDLDSHVSDYQSGPHWIFQVTIKTLQSEGGTVRSRLNCLSSSQDTGRFLQVWHQIVWFDSHSRTRLRTGTVLLYKCTVREYHVFHKWDSGDTPSQEIEVKDVTWNIFHVSWYFVFIISHDKYHATW
jgi:hypothetical protein